MCYNGDMPLDHFVAQTVLGAWCDPKTGKLQAYRKSTGGRFTPTPKGVCAQHGDDENPYLETPDLLGQFRSLWEPHWTAAVEGFRRGVLDANNKYALSLGWASMMATTPTSWGAHSIAVAQSLPLSIASCGMRPPARSAKTASRMARW